jgi:hypothetical protein
MRLQEGICLVNLLQKYYHGGIMNTTSHRQGGKATAGGMGGLSG